MASAMRPAEAQAKLWVFLGNNTANFVVIDVRAMRTSVRTVPRRHPVPVKKPITQKVTRKAPSSKPPPRTLGAVAATAVIPIVPLRPAVSFKVGDKCVHPAHGVGVIVSIDQLDLGGTKGDFYKLQIIDNGLRLLVPVSATTQAGLRPIMSSREADRVIETLKAPEVAVDVQPWSRRFRLYTEMVKSGIAIEIAKVLRDISRLRSDKDLSFGERRLLDQARSLLLKELALAKNISEDEMSAKLAKMFDENHPKAS